MKKNRSTIGAGKASSTVTQDVRPSYLNRFSSGLLFLLTILGGAPLYAASAGENAPYGAGWALTVEANDFTTDQQSYASFDEPSYYIDDALTNKEVLVEGLTATTAYHLFSHGRAGALLLDGQWLAPQEIAAWLRIHAPNKKQLNIYGCNFGEGEAGKAAVAYLESELGISVAASDDLTGIDGDWELEVGTAKETLRFPSYTHNLQAYVECATFINGIRQSRNISGDAFQSRTIAGKTYLLINTRDGNGSNEYPVINGQPLPSTTNERLGYFAIFDENCNQTLGTYIGSADGREEFSSFILDDDGNIVLVGTTTSDLLTTDGTTNAGETDVLLVKIAPSDGSIIFATQIGGSRDDYNGVLSFDDNTYYITGNSDNSFDFPTTDGSNALSDVRVLVLRYDYSGNLLSSFFPYSTPDDFQYQGDIIALGGGAYAIEYSDLITESERIEFYDASDALVSSYFFGDASYSSADYFSRMFLEGGFLYAVSLGAQSLVKLDLSGNLIYSTTFTGIGTGGTPFRSLEVVNDMTYVLSNTAITKFSPSGAVVFETPLPSGLDPSYAIDVDAAGNVYFIAESSSGTPPTLDGSAGDLVIGKVNPSGELSLLSAIAMTGINVEYIEGFTVENNELQIAFQSTGNSYTTDGTLYNNNDEGFTFMKIALCPPATAPATDDITPATQTVCINGLVEQLLGDEIVIEGSSFPPIYDDGALTDQQDIALNYQWESAPTDAGPWTPVSLLGKQKNYSPPPTSVTVYYRRVTSTSACCGGIVVSTSSVSEVMVTGDVAPAITLPSLVLTCPGSSLDLVATVTGGTPDYTYAWSDGTTTTTSSAMDMINVTPTATSVYEVRVTDANGCVQVEQAPGQIYQADAGPDASACAGAPVTIGGTPFPGVAIVPEGAPVANEYSIAYTWSPAAGLSCTDCPNPVASPVAAETYTLNVTIYQPDGTPCTTTSSMNVAVASGPTVADFAGIDQVVCNGETASLGLPSDATTYNIASGTATTGGPIVVADFSDDDFTTGVKTIDGTAENVVLDLGSPQTVNQIEIAILDDGASADSYFNIEVSTDNATWAPLFSGVGTNRFFPTTVPDDATTVLSFPRQDVRYFRFVPVFGSRDVGISEFAAGDGFTYVWAPGRNLAASGSMATFDAGFVLNDVDILNDPNPFTYTLSAEFMGCLFVDDVSVAMIEARAGEDGCGPRLLGWPDRTPNITETYSWVRNDALTTATTPSDFLGATDIPLPPVSASVGGDTYFDLTVTYTLPNGQMSTCTDQVIVPDCGPCGIDFAKQNGCPDFDIYGATQITATINSGTELDSEDFTVTWSPMAGLDTYTERTVTLMDNVDRTYTVTFTSTVDPTFICIETVRVNDPAHSLPVFNADPTVDVCTNDPIFIGDANMNPDLDYLWIPAEGLNNATLSRPQATVASTATYRAVVTDRLTGCIDTATVIVNVNGFADAGPDVFVCDNAVVTLGTPALPGYTYAWSPVEADLPAMTYRNGTSSTDAVIEVFATADQQYTLTTTRTTAPLCPTVDVVDIFVADLPAPFTLTSNPFCPSDGPVVLGWSSPDGTGTNNVPALVGTETYAWSPSAFLDDPTAQNPTLSIIPVEETTFTLTISSGPGCNTIGTQTLTPTVLTPMVVAAAPVICVDEMISVGSDGNTTGVGITYTWAADAGNPAGGVLVGPNDPNPIFSSSMAGNYTYTVSREEGGCTTEATIMISVIELVIAPVAPVSICQGNTVQLGLTPTEGLSYDWFPATGLSDPFIANPIFTGTESEVYTLTVMNSQGCTEEVRVAITVSVDPAAMVTLPDNIICDDSDLDFTITPTVEPAGTYSYAWSPVTYLSNPSILNPMVSLPAVGGDYPFTLVVTNQMTGCTTEETVTYTYVATGCVFDMALTKALATGQSNEVFPGNDIVFTISVFNQGTTDATSIEVTDYLPTNTAYTATGSTASGALTTTLGATANLVNNGDGTFTIDALAGGDNVSFDIAITTGLTTDGLLTNTAEITSAVGGIDEDSPLASVIGQSDDASEVGSDGDIADDRTGGTDNPADEDDYDLQQFTVMCTQPTVTASTMPTSCVDGVSQTDGVLQIDANTDGTAYHWSIGSTFDDNGGANTFANATSLTGATFPLQIATDLPNPATATQDYTIRIYNSSAGCFIDEVVMLSNVPALVVTVAEPSTICSTQSIDLTQGASITPTSYSGTWSTPDGSAANFAGGITDFATATTYTPDADDARRGSVTLVLTVNDSTGACGPESATVTIQILPVDCGTYPWDGDRD